MYAMIDMAGLNALATLFIACCVLFAWTATIYGVGELYDMAYLDRTGEHIPGRFSPYWLAVGSFAGGLLTTGALSLALRERAPFLMAWPGWVLFLGMVTALGVFAMVWAHVLLMIAPPTRRAILRANRATAEAQAPR